MNILRWIFDRLDERSTWLSIGMLLSSAGIHIDDEIWSAISTAGTSIFAALLLLLPDGKIPKRLSIKKFVDFKNGK